MEYLCLIPQNVQDLDVGQLELFVRSLNVKYTRRLQNFTETHPAHGSPPLMFVFHKPVLSLARPSFLTGAIIETRFQASLLNPP